MAVSEASICNKALTFLGANRISSLDEDSLEAKLCKEHYADVRDDLLRSHPWKFALARVELAKIATAPAFGWDCQFQLPNDCLRVVELDGQEADNWTVEGTTLLTNVTVAKIKYIKRVTVTVQFDSVFTTVLALDLGILLSYALTTSQGIRSDLVSLREAKIKEARTFSAQESVGDRVYADEWLNYRGN